MILEYRASLLSEFNIRESLMFSFSFLAIAIVVNCYYENDPYFYSIEMNEHPFWFIRGAVNA